MFGTASDQIEVKVPASEAWKIYGTLQLAEIAQEALPQWFQKIEVVEGDGRAGTILDISFSSGAGLSSRKEKFTVVDDDKRVKEIEVVEGGYLDMGFTFYRGRLQVIENEENSCITKATIEYEVEEEFAANASFATIKPLVDIMAAAANYLEKKE
ncbi:Bet v 1 domain-containing protein [Abeliophyllum distichum]|uniref:Bet v 1 domain-containing protein n=1 Tax=Abeliophyllum distichum TaxID=126358 RepID=A0ABD1UHD4_9LAMI